MFFLYLCLRGRVRFPSLGVAAGLVRVVRRGLHAERGPVSVAHRNQLEPLHVQKHARHRQARRHGHGGHHQRYDVSNAVLYVIEVQFWGKGACAFGTRVFTVRHNAFRVITKHRVACCLCWVAAHNTRS